ncbi:MAG: DNA-3-methyladenine glycosylase [Ignavibacteriae bacterium]|nr:DNA-3-methyladenine glycosylase [Ignavibacteriota bacterium]
MASLVGRTSVRHGGRNKFRPTKLSRSFYLRPTLTVAKDLLGKYFVRVLPEGKLVGKIVEVEAYLPDDVASHSYRGQTKRNEVMFLKGGHLYVYFTYGMHFCANVVTEQEGIGAAVLIRGIEPLQGIKIMEKNRGLTGFNLTNGPAKICQAFSLGRKENGVDLSGNEIYITEGESIHNSQVRISSRIGITNGKDKLWRFFLQDDPWVSKK